MEIRDRGNFACFMVISIIAFLILQSATFSITYTYEIPSGYYVSAIIEFEADRTMVCSSYSSIGEGYELQLIRGVGRLYAYENLEKEINGKTISSFIFNTGEEGKFLLKISPDSGGLSIKVKFTNAIPHIIFSGGIWIFGILFVIMFLIDKFEIEKKKSKLKNNKDSEQIN